MILTCTPFLQGRANRLRIIWNVISWDRHLIKHSIAPISTKGIELSLATSTGTGLTHSPGTMQGSSTNDQSDGVETYEEYASLKRCVFKWWPKESMLLDDITCSKSEFQRVGTATEKSTSPSMRNRQQVNIRWTGLFGLGC